MEQAPENNKSVDAAKPAIIEHLLIRDKNTKLVLINKRGNPPDTAGGFKPDGI